MTFQANRMKQPRQSTIGLRFLFAFSRSEGPFFKKIEKRAIVCPIYHIPRVDANIASMDSVKSILHWIAKKWEFADQLALTLRLDCILSKSIYEKLAKVSWVRNWFRTIGLSYWRIIEKWKREGLYGAWSEESNLQDSAVRFRTWASANYEFWRYGLIFYLVLYPLIWHFVEKS